LDKAAIYVYLGSFLLLVLAGLGLPVPEEVPIVTAGALVGHASEEPPPYPGHAQATAVLAVAPQAGFPAALPWAALAQAQSIEAPPTLIPVVHLHTYIMLPVLILGVVISDCLLYGIGRYWGPRILETPWMRRVVTGEKRQRIEENFHRYGVLVLLFARFLPTIRSPVFIMAGTMRVPFKRFLLADGLYALPGVSLLFFLAFWFGDSFRELVYSFEGRVARARPIIILALVAAATCYLIYHFFRHPVATGDPRQELPIIGPQVAQKIKCPDDEPPILEEGKWVCPDGSKPISQSSGSGEPNQQSGHHAC
jgi:membrane protein DedA with SNARE-associated domain